MLRFRKCRGQATTSDARSDLLFGESFFRVAMEVSNDQFGIQKVERRRAEAESQERAIAAKAAVDKQQKEQANAEAAALSAEIRQIDASNDLKSTYDTISSLREKISSLPADIRDKLLDELQIASSPVDMRRTALLAELQHKLMDAQKLPDNDEKLRVLDELADSVKAVPGSDANALAGMIDTIRATTRTTIGESANTPNAATIAERDQLNALADKDRAQQQAAKDAADALKAQQDKLRADARQATENLGTMLAIFSVAEVCAQSNMIFDDKKIDALKSSIKQYIEKYQIDRGAIDQTWKAVQQGMATTPVRESDCAGLGGNISAVFGPNVFQGTIEKNPF